MTLEKRFNDSKIHSSNNTLLPIKEVINPLEKGTNLLIEISETFFY
jgi:hypothetical protein